MSIFPQTFSTKDSYIPDPPFTRGSFKMTVNLISQDIVANTSLVSVALSVSSKPETGSGDSAEGNIYFNGAISPEYSISTPTQITRVIKTNTYTVNHNQDGTGSFNCRIRGRVRAYTGDRGFYVYTRTESFTLPAIPRVSTINAPLGGFSYNIGDDLQITITKSVASYTDNVTVKVAGVLIKTFTDFSSQLWAPSAGEIAAMYAALPNDNSGEIVVEVETFNGATSIGTNDASGTALVTNSNPAFNDFTYADINTITVALTGNNQNMIQGYATARATISVANKAVAQNGASMVSYIMNIGGQQASAAWSDIVDVNIDISDITTGTIQIFAVDSRGNQTLVVKAATLIAYTDIVASAALTARDNDVDEETSAQVEGTFTVVDFGLDDNEVSASYEFKETSASSYTPGTTTLAVTEGASVWDIGKTVAQYIIGDTVNGFSINKSFDVRFTISDKLSSVTVLALVTPGVPLIHYLKEGLGILKFLDPSDGYEVDLAGSFNVSEDLYEGGVKLGDRYAKLAFEHRVQVATASVTIDNISINDDGGIYFIVVDRKDCNYATKLTVNEVTSNNYITLLHTLYSNLTASGAATPSGYAYINLPWWYISTSTGLTDGIDTVMLSLLNEFPKISGHSDHVKSGNLRCATFGGRLNSSQADVTSVTVEVEAGTMGVGTVIRIYKMGGAD